MCYNYKNADDSGTFIMSDDLLGKEYIFNWTLNARQHFVDDDYEWLCDLIQHCFPEGACKRIFELGCGAGYSTLTFLLRGYRVVSVDINDEAITHTNALIKKHNYTSEIKTSDGPESSQVAALLWKKDLIEEWGLVYALAKQQSNLNPIDLIVLCNPGGNISRELTPREQDLLKSGGFSCEEICDNIHNGCIDLLHKWALIYAACALSKATGIPLLIVEREAVKEVNRTLAQISNDTDMAIVRAFSRPIKIAPDGGTLLRNTTDATDQLCWGAAIYISNNNQPHKISRAV